MQKKKKSTNVFSAFFYWRSIDEIFSVNFRKHRAQTLGKNGNAFFF